MSYISFIFILFSSLILLFFIGAESSALVLYVSLVLSFLLLIYSYKCNKIAFFLLIQFFVAFIWCSLSLFYIENNNYISEQDVVGSNIGSLFRYLFYYSIFIISSYVFLMLKSDKMKNKPYSLIDRNKKVFHLFVNFFFISILTLSLLLGVVYGFPMLSGISRFEFYQRIAPFDKVIFLMPILSFFLGVSYALTGLKKNIYCILCIVLLLILFSDKFSGIFGVALYYTIGFYLTKNIINNTLYIGFSKKVLSFYFPILFVFLVSVVVYGYFALHGASESDIGDRLLSRAFGLQAHVWYGIDYRLYFDIVENEMSIFFLQSKEPEQPAGLAYLMYQVADYNFVRVFREAGIRFTNGYPAIVLISFGYFNSIFILMLLGFLVGSVLYYLYLKVYFLQPLRLFLVLVFYNNIVVNIFIMGEVFYVYKILSVMCLLFIFVDVFILKHKNFKISFKR